MYVCYIYICLDFTCIFMYMLHIGYIIYILYSNICILYINIFICICYIYVLYLYIIYVYYMYVCYIYVY